MPESFTTVWSWGWGADGQLGLGKNCLSSYSPKALSFDDLPRRQEVCDSSIISVQCAERYSVIVTVSGRIFVWGLCWAGTPLSKENVSTNITPSMVPTRSALFQPRELPALKKLAGIKFHVEVAT